MERLNELAVQLMNCRKRGNKVTLECVLESARILAEAKAIAGPAFGIWLIERAHMDRATAYRHLAVARFVRTHVALTRQIATLSMAKIYAVSGLDSAQAVRVLTGQVRFSAPLEILCDVQFRREFRRLFPGKAPRHTREHVYRTASSALTRAVAAVQEATTLLRRMTAVQRHKIEAQIQMLVKLVGAWKGVA